MQPTSLLQNSHVTIIKVKSAIKFFLLTVLRYIFRGFTIQTQFAQYIYKIGVINGLRLLYVVATRYACLMSYVTTVNQRRARLVLRWVTVSGFNSRWGTFISVCDQPPRSTQPDHPFVGRRNEYQPKGGDALRLGSKGRYGSCVGGR